MNLRRIALLAAGAAFFAGLVATGPLSGLAWAQNSPDKDHGKAVFDHWCAPCHAPGPGHPGTQGLAIKYQGTNTPAPLEAREDLTPLVVKTFVRQGVLAMAPFRKTEVTDADLDALAAYLSN
jgi:mono/diheme cytochrome c family protein